MNTKSVFGVVHNEAMKSMFSMLVGPNDGVFIFVIPETSWETIKTKLDAGLTPEEIRATSKPPEGPEGIEDIIRSLSFSAESAESSFFVVTSEHTAEQVREEILAFGDENLQFVAQYEEFAASEMEAEAEQTAPFNEEMDAFVAENGSFADFIKEGEKLFAEDAEMFGRD